MLPRRGCLVRQAARDWFAAPCHASGAIHGTVLGELLMRSRVRGRSLPAKIVLDPLGAHMGLRRSRSHDGSPSTRGRSYRGRLRPIRSGKDSAHRPPGRGAMSMRTGAVTTLDDPPLVLAPSERIFRDRHDAGIRLAKLLAQLSSE